MDLNLAMWHTVHSLWFNSMFSTTYHTVRIFICIALFSIMQRHSLAVPELVSLTFGKFTFAGNVVPVEANLLCLCEMGNYLYYCNPFMLSWQCVFCVNFAFNTARVNNLYRKYVYRECKFTESKRHQIWAVRLLVIVLALVAFAYLFLFCCFE